MLSRRPLDRGEILFDLLGRAVQLDDQDRAAVRRVVRTDGPLGSVDRDRVHHLDRGRNDPGRDRPRDGRARRVCVREAREQRPHRGRRPQQAQRHARRDPKRALRPDERAEQIGPLVPDRERHELARRQDDVGRETWLTVNPYLRQCAPPEFSARLPPIVQTCCDDGSGA